MSLPIDHGSSDGLDAATAAAHARRTWDDPAVRSALAVRAVDLTGAWGHGFDRAAAALTGRERLAPVSP